MNRKLEIYQYYEKELEIDIDNIESERESIWIRIKSFFKEILKLPTYKFF